MNIYKHRYAFLDCVCYRLAGLHGRKIALFSTSRCKSLIYKVMVELIEIVEGFYSPIGTTTTHMGYRGLSLLSLLTLPFWLFFDGF